MKKEMFGKPINLQLTKQPPKTKSPIWFQILEAALKILDNYIDD